MAYFVAEYTMVNTANATSLQKQSGAKQKPRGILLRREHRGALKNAAQYDARADLEKQWRPQIPRHHLFVCVLSLFPRREKRTLRLYWMATSLLSEGSGSEPLPPSFILRQTNSCLGMRFESTCFRSCDVRRNSCQ